MSDVLFPIVGSSGTQIATVRCDRLDAKDYPAGRALVLARDEQEIERILADARAREPSGPEIVRPIWVRFIPQQFTGRSYGLALALADKRSRYRRGRKPDDGRLFATGIIVEDGFGEIGEVDAFTEKLAAIADEAKPGDIVALPKGNVERLSPEAEGLLEEFDQSGVIWRAADYLDELVDLYEAPTKERALVRSGRQKRDRGASLGQNEDVSRSTSRAEIRPSGSFRRLAATVALVLATGVIAFTAGDWSRDRSVVASYAGEHQPVDEVARTNLLENPSFEQGEGQQPEGWITFSRGKHDHADHVRAGGIDGSLVLEHRSDKAFYVDTHQVLQVPNGFYTFSAWVSSVGERKANRMRANGGDPVEVDIPITDLHSFQQLQIDCINVTNGRLAVGFYMDAYKDSSAAYDKAEVMETSKTVDGRNCVDIEAAGSSAATSSVDTLPGENLVTNPSFEQGQDQDPIGWGTFSRGKHDEADSVQPGGADGSLALEHRGDDAFYVDTYQVLGVANGYYAMSAWVNADGVDKVNRMYARGDDVIELDIPKNGAGGYRQFQIHCIEASEQKVVVGFYTDTHQASVVAYDNVRLVRHDQTADGGNCAEN